MTTINDLLDAANQPLPDNWFIYKSTHLVLIDDGTCHWVCLRADWDRALDSLDLEAEYEDDSEAYCALCDQIEPVLDYDDSQCRWEIAERYADELDNLCPEWRSRFSGEK